MLPDLYGKVRPRLLRPLETRGNTLRPCLVHGDLWDGNAAVQAKSSRLCFFDASSLWAHNEYDMHTWRASRYRVGRTFLKKYFRRFPMSPPEEGWDDRNQLYSLISNLHSSTLYTQSGKFRDLLIQSIRALIENFPNGYEGSAERKSA